MQIGKLLSDRELASKWVLLCGTHPLGQRVNDKSTHGICIVNVYPHLHILIIIIKCVF